MEYIKNDLNEEISAKIIEDTHYPEEDIWFFLYCLLSGLLYYKAFKVPHNDLKPNNIFLSQNGVYKIVDHTLFNNISSYMQLQWNAEINHNNIYLSPDLLRSLGKDLVEPKHNPYKSDIFTLGMVVLHMTTLENCDECYDYQSFKLRNGEIDKRLANLKKQYGDKLYYVIKGMLIEDENERPEYDDLLKMLHGSYDMSKDYRFKEVFD